MGKIIGIDLGTSNSESEGRSALEDGMDRVCEKLDQEKAASNEGKLHMTLETIAPDMKINTHLSDDGLDLIFRKARTFDAWRNRSVQDDLLRQVYDLAKMAPPAPTCAPRDSYLLFPSRPRHG